jgi:microcystin-dependent protein
MSFFKWSKTANNNASADGTINWAEGQAPSTVNDSARAMMAAAAKYRDDIAGVTTGGTATAYTVASNQAFDSLASMDGKIIALIPHVTSGAGPVTLNVDGLGARALRSSPGVELAAGTLISGTPYVARYVNSAAEWILCSFFGANPYNVPLGSGMPYFLPAAPNSSFAFPAGQPISRTTYAALFALMGTTYGAGDGSTTFNLPSLGGRLLACRENMNGAGVEGRITLAGSGITGTTLGATGGAQNVILAIAEIPSHTHANSLSDPGHAHGVSDPTHAHGVNDPGHTHTIGKGGTTQPVATNFSQAGVSQVSDQLTGLASTGVSIQAAATGISIQAAGTNASVVNAPAGGGGAHNNMPPIMIVNYVIRVI